MREIKAQTLCREAFRPYGDFMDLLHVKQIEAKPEANNVFAPDLVTLHLDGRMPASACVARVSECERIITALEYHQFTCEGILPLDGDIDIFVGPSSFRVDPATVEAFRVLQGTFVKLNPGVLHGRQFVVNTPAVNVLVLLPERTFGNDCTFTMLEGEDRIRILP